MSRFLIVLVLITLTSCSIQNSKYKLSVKQSTELFEIAKSFNEINFVGSVHVINKELRNERNEIINKELSDSIYKILIEYKVVMVVVYPEFVYYMMGSFNGTSFGLLLSEYEKKNLLNFYDVQEVYDTCQHNSKWFFVSSRYY